MAMLKRLIRSRPVQGAFAALAAGWMRLVARTTRWRVEGAEVVEQAWREGGGLVGLVWHNRLMLVHSSWPESAPQKPAILISLSRDGQFVADAARRLGLVVVRGSTRRKDRAAKDKGGEAAYRHMIAHIESGGVLCMMPDGPRGPRMRASPGAVRLARQTRAPILLLGIGTRRRIVLKTWDRLVLPLPFGTGAMVWDGLIPPPPEDADAETLERVRAGMEARLIAATQRADALAGASVIEPAPEPQQQQAPA